MGLHRTKYSTRCDFRPEALLIDMDGVLFDTESHSIDLIRNIVARQGLTITREYIIAHMGYGPADLLDAYQKHLGPTFDPKLYWQTYWSERNAFYDQNPLPLKPGAAALLESCSQAGIPCILATSSPQQEGLASLCRAGIDQYFSDVVGGDMFRHSKPQPDIYLTAAGLAKTPIENCLVLEDSLNGLKAGRASGACTAMIPDIVPYSEAYAPFCDYLCGTLDDIKPLLSRHCPTPHFQEVI